MMLGRKYIHQKKYIYIYTFIYTQKPTFTYPHPSASCWEGREFTKKVHLHLHIHLHTNTSIPHTLISLLYVGKEVNSPKQYIYIYPFIYTQILLSHIPSSLCFILGRKYIHQKKYIYIYTSLHTNTHIHILSSLCFTLG